MELVLTDIDGVQELGRWPMEEGETAMDILIAVFPPEFFVVAEISELYYFLETDAQYIVAAPPVLQEGMARPVHWQLAFAKAE